VIIVNRFTGIFLFEFAADFTLGSIRYFQPYRFCRKSRIYRRLRYIMYCKIDRTGIRLEQLALKGLRLP
jgi:hypothetical protein